MTWSQSVDQALCYGWIDGIRQKVDKIKILYPVYAKEKDHHSLDLKRKAGRNTAGPA